MLISDTKLFQNYFKVISGVLYLLNARILLYNRLKHVNSICCG